MHTVQDFFKSELYAGTIISIAPLPKAHVPAWELCVDFGPLGIKQSSARITRLYDEEYLLNRQVIALLNVPPRQVGSIQSECLVLGLPMDEHPDTEVILLQPERTVPNGTRVY